MLLCIWCCLWCWLGGRLVVSDIDLHYSIVIVMLLDENI